MIVGQRVQTVKNTTADLNVSSSMENKVNELDARSITLAENPTLMSDEDYDTLLRIVAAEAGSVHLPMMEESMKLRSRMKQRKL